MKNKFKAGEYVSFNIWTGIYRIINVHKLNSGYFYDIATIGGVHKDYTDIFLDIREKDLGSLDTLDSRDKERLNKQYRSQVGAIKDSILAKRERMRRI